MDGEFFQWPWLLRAWRLFWIAGRPRIGSRATSSFSFRGVDDRAGICDCVGMAPSRSSGGNSVVGGPELCAGEYFLLFIRIHAIWIYGSYSADVAAPVRIHGDRCGAGAWTRRVR